MSKVFGVLFSVFMTCCIGLAAYEQSAVIGNLVQVVFWVVIVISYPVYALVFVGVVMQKDKPKNAETIKNLKRGKIATWFSGFLSITNVILMSLSGFFWLPIAYSITCLISIIAKAMIIEAAKDS
jgi:preprotein translocase subunit SecG